MDKQIVDNITTAWQEVVMNEKKKLDPVNHKELKGKHSDRDDKDVDNDGDVDSSDQYLHKRRKAISKDMKEDDDMETDEPMAKDGMKKCGECKGSTENHDEECSKYKGEEKQSTKESVSVRHTEHGHGEIISESDEGFDILFDHGVEFNVPAEQLEGVSSAIKTAKRMGGNMTGAVKKIDKAKKGMSDNPRVQKALRKANEEVESVQEGTVAEAEEVIKNAYNDRMSSVVEKLQRMWEKASVGSAGKPSESMLDQYKGKGAKDMAKDHSADKPTHADVPEISQAHDDVAKAGRATKAAPARGAADNLSNGEKKIVKGGK